jgi:hypothetical protein
MSVLESQGVTFWLLRKLEPLSPGAAESLAVWDIRGKLSWLQPPCNWLLARANSGLQKRAL